MPITSTRSRSKVGHLLVGTAVVAVLISATREGIASDLTFLTIEWGLPAYTLARRPGVHSVAFLIVLAGVGVFLVWGSTAFFWPGASPYPGRLIAPQYRIGTRVGWALLAAFYGVAAARELGWGGPRRAPEPLLLMPAPIATTAGATLAAPRWLGRTLVAVGLLLWAGSIAARRVELRGPQTGKVERGSSARRPRRLRAIQNTARRGLGSRKWRRSEGLRP